MSRSQRRARSRAPKAQAPFARDLRAILRGLARAAAISSVGLAGCSSHHPADEMRQRVPAGEMDAGTRPRDRTDGATPGAIPAEGGVVPTPDASESEGWTYLGCGAMGSPSLLSGLNLKRDVDHAALHATHADEDFWTDAGPEPIYGLHQLESTGTPCATATDAVACRAALDAVLVPTEGRCGWWSSMFDCDPFLVITAGDEVSRVEEQAALTALLGSVDTPAEAALIALLIGDHQPACTSDLPPKLRGTQTRPVADGYEVRTERVECGAALYRTTVHVSSDGTFTFVALQKIGEVDC
jgi:hypothetical protein